VQLLTRLRKNEIHVGISCEIQNPTSREVCEQLVVFTEYMVFHIVDAGDLLSTA